MKEQKLTPSELASKLAPVKIDENSKFGTGGFTNTGTSTTGACGLPMSDTNTDSWTD